MNFGHTLGHALEAQGGFERLLHGEAVSLGMVAALRVGVEMGITDPETEARVTRLLARLGLPVDLAGAPVDEGLRVIHLDKKRQGDALRLIVIRRAGEPAIERVPVDALRGYFGRAARPRDHADPR